MWPLFPFAQQLFLKERNPKRAFEHWFKRWVRIGNVFASLPPLQKRIHHLANDGPRADDRDLYHDVIEAFRTQARQARHLRTAFHLEQAYRVGLLQCGIDRRIIWRQVRQVNFFAVVIANEFDGILKHGHHAKAEKIDLDDTHVGAIFLVPLHHDAAGHGGGFERDDGIELSLANHHAARMLAKMPRHVLHGEAQLVIFAQARMLEIKPGIAEAAVEFVILVAELPGGDRGGNLVERFRIESQRLSHFPCCHAVAIGDDVRGHGSAALAITPVDVLNDLLAFIPAGQVEIDVGPFAALFGKEALKEQFHADGIDGGDAERVTDGAVGGRAAALHEDVLLAAVAD